MILLDLKSPFSFVYLQETDSTNSYAVRRLDDLEDRTVIVAERQTDGRGRLNRTWLSFDSNLTVSLVLKPKERPRHLSAVTQYASLSVSEAIDEYGVQSSLKWPNDVLAGGAKIAGILSECTFSGERLAGCVLGIGANLNMTEEQLQRIDHPAASLNLLTGSPVDREAFLERLLGRFFEGYDRFLNEGFTSIKDRFVGKSTFLGENISIVSFESHFHGIAKDIGSDGSLCLQLDGGEQMSFNAGEIVCCFVD